MPLCVFNAIRTHRWPAGPCFIPTSHNMDPTSSFPFTRFDINQFLICSFIPNPLPLSPPCWPSLTHTPTFPHHFILCFRNPYRQHPHLLPYHSPAPSPPPQHPYHTRSRPNLIETSDSPPPPLSPHSLTSCGFFVSPLFICSVWEF